ncbi:Retrovirus-related Pol polyprotein from transposon TNT 1-94 [Vitis vinifera]|uniref:Retrovirus-related Pol polyprotein from transposon TNT 1-94 n=1 Tax=Vitis vinifera TaxID=29760 RepID=A0A438K6L9_VITVI|nr:Retrovirus-related Pol polyprotein from transposon TNT 1-94 [Vitis vinifera]
MDVKTTFLNGNLEEEVYMKQPEGFSSSSRKHLDMGDATYVIGFKIQRDRFRGLIGLSQETYINKVLDRFRMKDCSPSIAPIVKGDRFNLDQCPKNDLEREQMKNIPYASAVGSLMYVQVCTRPDIAFAVGIWTDNLEVIGYSDLDYAGCIDSRKSTSGYVFMLAGGAVS